jgi:hypothetical protein
MRLMIIPISFLVDLVKLRLEHCWFLLRRLDILTVWNIIINWKDLLLMERKRVRLKMVLQIMLFKITVILLLIVMNVAHSGLKSAIGDFSLLNVVVIWKIRSLNFSPISVGHGLKKNVTSSVFSIILMDFSWVILTRWRICINPSTRRIIQK